MESMCECRSCFAQADSHTEISQKPKMAAKTGEAADSGKATEVHECTAGSGSISTEAGA